MRLFLYEYITAGGTWHTRDDDPPSGSLLEEGAAMVASMATDLLALEQVDVTVLRDVRLPPLWPDGCRAISVDAAGRESKAFDEALAECDAAWLIAPEFDGILAARAQRAEACGVRLVSPGDQLVTLAASKQRTASFLAAAGIRVPDGRLLKAGEPLPIDFPYPAVLKRDDGAGSCDIRLISGPDDAGPPRSATGKPFRLEAFVPGTAASVALLCGPRDTIVLPPCRQRLSHDGRFTYLGGQAPLPEPERTRAANLGRRVANALPPTVGYLGIDLVLSNDPVGSNDTIIEINPRLTTSYVGLRQIVQQNIAGIVLDLAEGRPVKVSQRIETNKAVKFSAKGQTDGCS